MLGVESCLYPQQCQSLKTHLFMEPIYIEGIRSRTYAGHETATEKII